MLKDRKKKKKGGGAFQVCSLNGPANRELIMNLNQKE